MGKALYRKYRSSSFDEVIGQDHITTTLKNSLKAGTFGHAYLLSGPRGVGKTSVARILAYAVNDLPYQKDGHHLDIIEIDAASNRRIDEIRSLREKVSIAPTSAKYKVYIIDEVHMLTREAFNALLKTLEEPPEHVIFILATTDVHKLPDTIVSRCITFTFRPIEPEAVVEHLAHIAKEEGFKISKDALTLIARHGEGSFRDSISLLDQIKHISSGTIEVTDVELALGLAPEDVIEKILSAIIQGDPALLNQELSTAYEKGASESNLARQLSELLRYDLLSGKPRLGSTASIELLQRLLDVTGSVKPRATLELALLDQLFKANPVNTSTQKQEKAEAAEIEVVVKLPETKEKAEGKEIAQPVKKKPEEPATVIELDEELWHNVLQKLKTRNNTLYGIARMAHANMNEGILTLSFKFPFHLKQINQPKNKSIITAVLKELGRDDIVIEVNLAGDKKNAAKSYSADKTVATITNIFGEGEVLES